MQQLSKGCQISPALGLGLLAALTLAAYSSGLGGDFLVDDRPLIVESTALTLRGGAAKFFTAGMWSFSSLRAADPYLYRPVFLAALAAQKDAFGLWPAGFHGVSVALHLIDCGLLYWLLRRLVPGAGGWIPVLGAAAFALHPAHVEAVSWISAQSHPLATAFALGALLCHLRFVEVGGRAGLALGAGLFLLGALTQEIVFGYPLLLASLALALRSRRHAVGAAAAGVALLLCLALRRAALGEAGGLPIAWASGRPLVDFWILSLRGLALPWPQPFYLATPPDAAGPGSVAVALLAVGGLIWAIAARRERGVALALGLAWTAWGLAPSLAAALHSPPRFALRSLYWGSGGACVLLAWLASACLPWLRRRARAAGLGLALALLAAALAIVAANRTWRDDRSAYSAAVRANPESFAAYEGLARVHEREGDLPGALANYQSAARRASGDARAADLENIGRLSAMGGRLPEAEQALRQAIELAPGRSGAWVGLGNLAYLRGRPEEALEFYRHGLALDPANYEACYDVALALRRLGRAAEAQEYEARLPGLRR